jgi:hypothetical protein
MRVATSSSPSGLPPHAQPEVEYPEYVVLGRSCSRCVHYVLRRCAAAGHAEPHRCAARSRTRTSSKNVKGSVAFSGEAGLAKDAAAFIKKAEGAAPASMCVHACMRACRPHRAPPATTGKGKRHEPRRSGGRATRCDVRGYIWRARFASVRRLSDDEYQAALNANYTEMADGAFKSADGWTSVVCCVMHVHEQVASIVLRASSVGCVSLAKWHLIGAADPCQCNTAAVPKTVPRGTLHSGYAAYPKGAYVLPYAARSAVYVVTHCVLLRTSHGLNCFGYSTILRVPPYIGRVVSMAHDMPGLCG